jgi:hypothetical protein
LGAAVAVESKRTTTDAKIDNAQLRRQIAADLRTRVLALTPADFEVDSRYENSRLFGILIETAHPDAVASLVAFADGSVSLYVSNGNGCFGCGMQREVQVAAAELLHLAERVVVVEASALDSDYPPSGTMRFCFLCRDGWRQVQLQIEELGVRDAPLSELYFAGQRLINIIERVGAGQCLTREIHRAEHFAQVATGS